MEQDFIQMESIEFPQEIVRKVYRGSTALSRNRRESDVLSLPFRISDFGTELEPDPEVVRNFKLSQRAAEEIYPVAKRVGNLAYLHNMVSLRTKLLRMNIMNQAELAFFGEISLRDPLEDKITFFKKAMSLTTFDEDQESAERLIHNFGLTLNQMARSEDIRHHIDLEAILLNLAKVCDIFRIIDTTDVLGKNIAYEEVGLPYEDGNIFFPGTDDDDTLSGIFIGLVFTMYDKYHNLEGNAFEYLKYDLYHDINEIERYEY